LLQRHQSRDIFGPFAQEAGGAAQDFRTLESGDMPPFREALLRGGKCEIEIGGFGARDLADRLLGRRVDDIKRPAGSAGPSFAVDHQQDIGIILCHFSFVREHREDVRFRETSRTGLMDRRTLLSHTYLI
jgi:hypothetical protein